MAGWPAPAGRVTIGASPQPAVVGTVTPWRRQRMWTAARPHETDRDTPEFMAACAAQRQ